MSEDVRKRFEAAEWNTLEIADGNDILAINAALEEAKNSSKPTMILLHTFIGFGTMNQGSSKTHGAPLKKDDYEASEEKFVKGYVPFHVDEDVYQDLKESFGERGAKAYEAYQKETKEYSSKYPNEYRDFQNGFERNVSAYSLSSPELKESESTRNASERFLLEMVHKLPFTFGGSADVASSVKTNIPGDPGFSYEHRDAKNINFGIREFLMAAAENGMLLHGGLEASWYLATISRTPSAWLA